jgi:hypothetical protein
VLAEDRVIAERIAKKPEAVEATADRFALVRVAGAAWRRVSGDRAQRGDAEHRGDGSNSDSGGMRCASFSLLSIPIGSRPGNLGVTWRSTAISTAFPVGDGAGWTHEPWGAEMVDGRI